MAEQRGQYRRCLDFNASELDSNNVNEDIPSAPFPVIGDANGKALRACTSLKYTNGGAYSNPMNKEHAVSASSRPSSRPSKSTHGFNNSSPTRHQNPQPRRSPRKSPRILSGIGLHLNSLSGRVGTLASTKRVTCFPQSLNSNDKSATIVLDSAQSAGRGVFVSVVEKTKTDCQEVQGTGSNHFGLFQSTTRYQSVTVGIQPVEESEPGKRVHLIGKKRLLDSEEEDSGTIQYSPKKRRKPLTTAGSTDGRCKRCNCKKSKCLKLYCECFAAGVYCMDSCMCYDCNNKPEYKATILGVRQQIESRNPLAFAPKIVHTEDHTPEMDESIDTSSSARHKHGCNCRKSLCLKKYCECYQAGVGCSDGCRCNGCKNVFGRKGGSEPQKIEKDIEAHSEDVFESYSSIKKTGSGSTNFFTDLNSKGHMQTTVFKVSNAVDVMVSKNVSPSTPSTGYSMRLRSSDKRIPIDGGSKSAVSSHLYINGLADSQANDDNRCIDESESIFEKLPPISPLMSFSCQTSLHVSDTPMTPTCILKRSNPLDACSVHKLAPSIEDEETPDFLRDTDEVQSPPRVLMANSPKQKRVTPPNFDVMNYTGGRITGLRNGKKLSLRALPSLPPIMPSASSMHARMALEQRMDELRRCLAGDVDNIK